MTFEVFTTTVELQDIPSYTTNITLEGQILRLSFIWNDRLGRRTIFIRNSADSCYLQNTILYPNESFELNSNAVFDDLPYKVSLQKVGDISKVGNIYNWSKDFILVFYRTVDVEAEKLNVRYGVTTPSTPSLPKPFGSWILNQGYELADDYIVYTAYKTNQISYYDSYANFDLVTALVRSFHDPDLQEYIAFTTSVDQLTGVVDWVLDPANNRIKYFELTDEVDQGASFGCNGSSSNSQTLDSVLNSCTPENWTQVKLTEKGAQTLANILANMEVGKTNSNVLLEVSLVNTNNSNPTPVVTNYYFSVTKAVHPAEREEKYLPFETVAQQVISNAKASSDQALKMLSEDYVEIVTDSIFDINISKQFIKIYDLIPQLETNKVLH